MNHYGYIYVIMPVDSDLLFSERRRALELGIKNADREARFPYSVSERPPFDISNFIEEIRGADSVIADLSCERPSCYYELGIVEALGKSVYLVAQVGTPIHQCFGRHGVRYYSDMAELARISHALIEIKND
jgi:hypothetical protein